MTVSTKLVEFDELVKALNKIVFGSEMETVTLNGIVKPTISNFLKNYTVSKADMSSVNAEIVNLNNAIAAYVGGRKAYTTLALAQADQANLPVNTAVEVTDDPNASNNGTYQWDGTTLTKSAFDPLAQAKNYADAAVNNAFTVTTQNYTVSPIVGYAINVDTPQTSIFSAAASDRSYLKIDVSTITKLTISNSTADARWRWVFRDANDVYISMTPFGTLNGTFDVPSNAKWAYRTYKVGTVTEGGTLTISGLLKNNVYSVAQSEISKNNIDLLNKSYAYTDKLLYSAQTELVVINPISGYSVQTGANSTAFLSPNSNDMRKYIVFDVTDYAKITVSGCMQISETGSWYWVFELADGSKLVSDYRFNGTFDVPTNAVKAYRTVYYEKDASIYDDIANGLTITATFKKQRIQPQIDTINTKIVELASGKEQIFETIEAMEKMLEQQNFISPNDFDDPTQMGRLKSAVNFVKDRGYGIIELGIDKETQTNLWTLTEALALPSNCWIYINAATVKRGNAVFDNIFRNDGIVPNDNPYNYATALNRNVNIRIFGNNKVEAMIDGNLANAYTAPHPIDGGNPVPWVADNYGWRTISVLFANTQFYKVHDLSFVASQNWTCSNEHGCEFFEYHDLSFRTTGKNGDGINVRTGCKNFEIYNIEARTSDDSIAINSLNNFISQHPTGNYIYPNQVGGYSDRGFGVDIYNGKIWNIKASSSGGVSFYFSGGSKIHDVSIDNLTEYDNATWNFLLHFSAAYGVGQKVGDLYNITVNNAVSNLTTKLVYLNAPLKDVWINKVTQNKADTPAITYGSLYQSDNVKITNVKEA